MPKRNHLYSSSTRTHDAAGEPFGIVVYKTQQTPSRLTCADPLDALVMALSYLREGFHVLLTDPTVEALKDDTRTVALDRLAERYRAARL